MFNSIKAKGRLISEGNYNRMYVFWLQLNEPITHLPVNQKKYIRLWVPPPTPPPPASLPPNISPQLACIEMDSTFYDVLKLKTAIKKVFLSTLVCSLFWNTFLFQLRATPPPPEYTYIYCSSMKYVLLRIQVFTYRHTCFIYFESYTIDTISVFVFVFYFLLHPIIH